MAKVYGDLCGTILCCPAKPSCTVLPRLCKNKKIQPQMRLDIQGNK